MGQLDREPVVLLVEDDADARAAIGALIERAGYLVVAATSGGEALQRLRGGLRPALIVLDLTLPDMSGFTFRDEQRKDAELADIPLIVESGLQDVRHVAEQLGATAYFQKPLDTDKILA